MRTVQLLLLAVLATAARADVIYDIYDSFGPGSSYLSTGLIETVTAARNGGSPNQYDSASFVVPATVPGNAWQIVDIETPLTNDSLIPLLNAGIQSVGGLEEPLGIAVPGELVTVNGPSPDFNFCQDPFNCHGTGSAIWNYNPLGLTGQVTQTYCYFLDCQVVTYQGLLPALRVFATPIPEPSTLLLLATATGIGIALLVVGKRKTGTRKKGPGRISYLLTMRSEPPLLRPSPFSAFSLLFHCG